MTEAPAAQGDHSATSAERRAFHVGMLWNLGSLVVLGVAGILLQIVIARWSGAAALGVFNQIFAIYIVASQLAVLGVHYSVLQAVSWAHDDREVCSQVTVSGLLTSLATSSAIAAVVWLAAPWAGRFFASPEVADGLPWIVPGLVVFALNKVLLNALNGISAMRAYAIFQAMRFVALLGGVAIVCWQGWPAAWLAMPLTAAELLLLPGLLWALHRGAIRLRFTAASWHWIRRHVSFGGRGFLAGSLTEINTRVDIVVLGLYAGDADVGVYSFGAILAEGFGQIGYIVRRSVDPKAGQWLARGHLAKIEALSREVQRWLVPAMLVLGAVAVALYRPLAFRIVEPEEFGASFMVFGLLMLGVVINARRRAFGGLLLQADRPGAHTLVLASLVIANLVLNLVWVPAFGIPGAAAATMMVLILEAVAIRWTARSVLNIQL